MMAVVDFRDCSRARLVSDGAYVPPGFVVLEVAGGPSTPPLGAVQVGPA